MWDYMAVGFVAVCACGNAFIAPKALPSAASMAKVRHPQVVMQTAEAAVAVLDKKEERRRILASPKYNRMGFKDHQQDVSDMMLKEFTSSLVKELKDNGNTIQREDVTVKLANSFGFCWGVERAVAMAYQARQHYPEQNMHITNELIHNPGVNEKLTEMGVELVKVDNNVKDFSKIKDGDVVILPAFGATLEELRYLDQKDVKIVDTTCPWVSKVWNTVDKHTKLSYTSVIHGKYAHEETVATASFAMKYLIVKNLAEAEYVCNYIKHGGDKAEFLKKFEKAVSKGFDPDVDLEKIGLANQTTMYKRETREIGKMLEKALMERHGPSELPKHYMAFDTICDATQERQDAILEMVEDKGIDMMLVVGGWDSSNTHHLAEITKDRGYATYWVNRAECIRPDGSILHLDPHSFKEVLTPNFLPEGHVTIGVTSGASTPDATFERCLENIFLLKKLQKPAAELQAA